MKQRLDLWLVERKLVSSRNQAESLIKLGYARVNGVILTKPAALVSPSDNVVFDRSGRYVSRAALKLASVAGALELDFRNKFVLDVGSSTGGFTQYALMNGAKKVVAVDVGTDQLHESLRSDTRIELHEQTDVRDYVKSYKKPVGDKKEAKQKVGENFSRKFDLILADVSFISLREILPSLLEVMSTKTLLVAMVKPQFEAWQSNFKHKGVIKNERVRRMVMKEFENWVKSRFFIVSKADSEVSGSKGNLERFYKLKKLAP